MERTFDLDLWLAVRVLFASDQVHKYKNAVEMAKVGVEKGQTMRVFDVRSNRNEIENEKKRKAIIS